MRLVAILREEIDRLVRPGQARASVVANRLLRGGGLSAGNAAMLNHLGADLATDLHSARYGRSRYGNGRYARTPPA